MHKLSSFAERHYRKICVFLTLAAAAVYAVLALDPLIWADEAYTFAMLRHSFSQIWTITAADVHPPLFYFITKLLSAPFGYSLYACRLLSALPCILLVVIAACQLPKLFGKHVSLLFLVLYLTFPYLMTCVVEVRMYSWAELFVFLNALYAYRCRSSSRLSDWLLFALWGVCAAYTHYFALVSAGVIYLMLLIFSIAKRRDLLKFWAIAAAVTVAAYLPWLGSFISQLIYKVETPYWIEPITLSTIISYVLMVFGTSGFGWFPLLQGSCYLAALVWILFKKNRSDTALCLCALAVPLGTIAVGLAASILVRPVFVIRYLQPALPLMVFFLAYALSKIGSRTLVCVALAAAILGGGVNVLVRARDAFFPSQTRISQAMVDAFPDHDACITLSGNALHTGQELSFRDPQTPIYTQELMGADNPYPNRLPLESFTPENHSRVIVFLQAGEHIPEDLLEIYNAEYLHSVTVNYLEHDVWYLTTP